MSPSMSNLQTNRAFSPTTRCGGTSMSFSLRARDVPRKKITMNEKESVEIIRGECFQKTVAAVILKYNKFRP